MPLFVILTAILVVACGRHEPKPDDSRSAELDATWAELHAQAKSLVGESCWLVTGGDGALWSGKYAAVTDCNDYPTAEVEPGRWLRSPGYVPLAPASGWSSWSRDMGMGLIAYAVQRRDLGALERHRDYGASHAWNMGKPLGDGRAVYSGNMLGYLYSGIRQLGGASVPVANIQRVLEHGTVDYKAHLTVMGIYLDSVTDHGITDDALKILEEAAERDPNDPLFSAVLARYTGDARGAINVCLASVTTGYAGEYVRCGDTTAGGRACFLAAWLSACGLLISGG